MSKKIIKMETLGSIIKTLRSNKKLTLFTVAKYLGIDQAILSKIERGQRKATRGQLLKLAEYYHVDLNELLLAWLSDKLVYELVNEEVALSALQLAEEKIAYQLTSKTNRKDVINNIRQVFLKFPAVQKAWLFGSFARDENTTRSDIDILIDVPEYKEFTLFDLAEIKEDLQFQANRNADIVMLSAIKPQVKKRINNDLILLYEAR